MNYTGAAGSSPFAYASNAAWMCNISTLKLSWPQHDIIVTNSPQFDGRSARNCTKFVYLLIRSFFFICHPFDFWKWRGGKFFGGIWRWFRWNCILEITRHKLRQNATTASCKSSRRNGGYAIFLNSSAAIAHSTALDIGDLVSVTFKSSEADSMMPRSRWWFGTVLVRPITKLFQFQVKSKLINSNCLKNCSEKSAVNWGVVSG